MIRNKLNPIFIYEAIKNDEKPIKSFVLHYFGYAICMISYKFDKLLQDSNMMRFSQILSTNVYQHDSATAGTSA